MKFNRCLLRNSKFIILIIVIGVLSSGCNKKNADSEMTDSTIYPDISVISNKDENRNSVEANEEVENTFTDEEKISAEKGIDNEDKASENVNISEKNDDTSANINNNDVTDLAAIKEKAALLFEQKPFQGTILIMKNDEII